MWRIVLWIGMEAVPEWWIRSRDVDYCGWFWWCQRSLWGILSSCFGFGWLSILLSSVLWSPLQVRLMFQMGLWNELFNKLYSCSGLWLWLWFRLSKSTLKNEDMNNWSLLIVIVLLPSKYQLGIGIVEEHDLKRPSRKEEKKSRIDMNQLELRLLERDVLEKEMMRK